MEAEEDWDPNLEEPDFDEDEPAEEDEEDDEEEPELKALPPEEKKKRKSARQAAHDLQFQTWLDCRRDAHQKVYGGKILPGREHWAKTTQDRQPYESAIGFLIDPAGPNWPKVVRCFELIIKQAWDYRRVFNEMFAAKGYDPDGKNMWGNHLGLHPWHGPNFPPYLSAIRYQLEHPLTTERIERWLPHTPLVMRRRDAQVGTYYVMGMSEHYNLHDLDVRLMWPGEQNGWYNWKEKQSSQNKQLTFHMTPPDGRGSAYFTTPWGIQVASYLMAHMDLLMENPVAPGKLSELRFHEAVLESQVVNRQRNSWEEPGPWVASMVARAESRIPILRAELEFVPPAEAAAQGALFNMDVF
jgi:hypothetical protein